MIHAPCHLTLRSQEYSRPCKMNEKVRIVPFQNNVCTDCITGSISVCCIHTQGYGSVHAEWMTVQTSQFYVYVGPLISCVLC